MSRTISKYRRYARTIYNSVIIPYDPFSETGRWWTNNLRYMLRRNNGKIKSDCPIKTIARRGKLVTMSTVRDLSKQIDFCMSDQKSEEYIDDIHLQ